MVKAAAPKKAVKASTPPPAKPAANKGSGGFNFFGSTPAPKPAPVKKAAPAPKAAAPKKAAARTGTVSISSSTKKQSSGTFSLFGSAPAAKKPKATPAAPKAKATPPKPATKSAVSSVTNVYIFASSPHTDILAFWILLDFQFVWWSTQEGQGTTS